MNFSKKIKFCLLSFFIFVVVGFPFSAFAENVIYNLPQSGRYIVGDKLIITVNNAGPDGGTDLNNTYICFDKLTPFKSSGPVCSSKVIANGSGSLSYTIGSTDVQSQGISIDVFFKPKDSKLALIQRNGISDFTFKVVFPADSNKTTTGTTGGGDGTDTTKPSGDTKPIEPDIDDPAEPDLDNGSSSGGGSSIGSNPLTDGLGAIKDQFSTTGKLTNPNQSVTDFIKNIIGLLLLVAMIIDVLFIIIGGYQYITSAGNEEQAGKGRKTLMYAIIGLAIIIFSYVIVSVVNRTLTKT